MHIDFLTLLRTLAPLFFAHHCLHSIGQVPEDPSLLSLNPAALAVVLVMPGYDFALQTCVFESRSRSEMTP